MSSGIGTTLRACAELIRPDLAFGAGFFVVAGEVLATGGLPPAGLAVSGFAALFLLSGSANISNDYFDREVDRINLPSRPLPSGRISARALWILFFLCSAAGLAAAALLGTAACMVAAFCWALSFAYNLKLKEYGLIGNLVVACCVGMTILLGGIAAGTANGLVLTFAALAFLFDLGAEIASDAMDVAGDRARPGQSLAKTRGRASALKTAGIVFTLFLALTILPFPAGWFGPRFIVPVAAAGIWMAACIVRLVRSETPEEGRIQVRRLYLSWGLLVIVITGLMIV